jgi:hypothetical protein
MMRRNSKFYVQMGCSVFVLMALFVCGLVIVFGKIHDDHLWDGAILTEGVVVSIESYTTTLRNGREHIDSEHVQFEYTIKGETSLQTQYFPYEMPFHEGQLVPVVYLPNTPWVARIVVDDSLNSSIFLALGLGALVLLGIMVIRFMPVAPPRQKRKEKPLL